MVDDRAMRRRSELAALIGGGWQPAMVLQDAMPYAAACRTSYRLAHFRAVRGATMNDFAAAAEVEPR